MTVKKTISSKAKTSTTKTKIRKKKSSDVKEDWPLTDFSEKPVPQNINHIEIGDFVKLGRSMVMLNGNILWMCGVEVKVKDLFTDNSGYTIAETVRPDGTEILFYACWLKPIMIEECIDINIDSNQETHLLQKEDSL